MCIIDYAVNVQVVILPALNNQICILVHVLYCNAKTGQCSSYSRWCQEIGLKQQVKMKLDSLARLNPSDLMTTCRLGIHQTYTSVVASAIFDSVKGHGHNIMQSLQLWTCCVPHGLLVLKVWG